MEDFEKLVGSLEKMFPPSDAETQASFRRVKIEAIEDAEGLRAWQIVIERTDPQLAHAIGSELQTRIGHGYKGSKANADTKLMEDDIYEEGARTTGGKSNEYFGTQALGNSEVLQGNMHITRGSKAGFFSRNPTNPETK